MRHVSQSSHLYQKRVSKPGNLPWLLVDLVTGLAVPGMTGKRQGRWTCGDCASGRVSILHLYEQYVKDFERRDTSRAPLIVRHTAFSPITIGGQ
jgi:hypothetical protein